MLRFSHDENSSAKAMDAKSATCAVKNSHSQWGEDWALLPLLPFGRQVLPSTPPTFVEIGAFDGIRFSNTLMLERCFGWTGLLVEANPGNFQRLQRAGRPRAQVLHAAACEEGASSVAVTIDATERAGQLRHMSGVGQRLLRHPRVASVPCLPLSRMASTAGLRTIDLLSVDVEGAEEEVLRTTDLSVVRVAMVEMDGSHPEREERIDALMHSAGFRHPGVWIFDSRVYARTPQGDICNGSGNRIATCAEMTCDMRHANPNRRGSDLMLIPTLLAQVYRRTGRTLGTFTETLPAHAALTRIMARCYSWQERHSSDSGVVDLWSTDAPTVRASLEHGPPRRWPRFHLVAVRQYMLEGRGFNPENGTHRLLLSQGLKHVRRLRMFDTRVYQYSRIDRPTT